MTASSQARHADVVVVGAGLAGLTASLLLAEAGLKVVTLARGLGSVRLAPATIDILGYAPDRVDNPAAALPAFVAGHPGHPYAHVSPDVLTASVTWLKDHVDGYRYVGAVDKNMLLPTAIGVPRPSAVVPEMMAAGNVRALRSVAVVGLRAFKDFHPSIAAENLRAAGIGVEARPVMLTAPVNGEADVGALSLARHFGERVFREAVAAELRSALRDERAVGVPAVLGLDGGGLTWSQFQEAVGRPVFEMPTIPPSVPGMRLAKALQDRLRRAGGRLVLGARAVGPQLRNGKLVGVRVSTAAAGRQTVRPCRWVVLATGGLASGGIEVDLGGTVAETAFGLPVRGPAEGEPAFSPSYLGDHPMETVGLRVDPRLRPLGPDGRPAFENLYAAGAIIGGARPWREKSGDGISLATGYLAGQQILQEAR